MTKTETIEEKKYVGANLDRQEYDKLKQLADAENRSISNMIRVCVLEFISDQGKR